MSWIENVRARARRLINWLISLTPGSRSLVALLLVVIIVLAFAAAAILLIPNFKIYEVDDPGERIGLAQWFVELAAVVAIGLAAYEFFQAQRRPKLSLLLRGDDPRSPTKHLTLPPNWSGEKVVVILSFVMENVGPSAARWIKVKVTAVDIEGMQSRVLLFRPLKFRSRTGTWSPITVDRTYHFIGDDNFICYARPKGGVHLPDWVDHLGDFKIEANATPGSPARIARLECSVWADGFARRDEMLTVSIS